MTQEHRPQGPFTLPGLNVPRSPSPDAQAAAPQQPGEEPDQSEDPLDRNIPYYLEGDLRFIRISRGERSLRLPERGFTFEQLFERRKRLMDSDEFPIITLSSTQQRTPDQSAQLEAIDIEIDEDVAIARDFGMLSGLDEAMDNLYIDVVSYGSATARMNKLHESGRVLYERINNIVEKMRERYSDAEVAAYIGVQKYYLERGLVSIYRQVAPKDDLADLIDLGPEREWEWKEVDFKGREVERQAEALRGGRLEHSLVDIKDEDLRQELGREASVRAFTELDKLLSSGDTILRYLEQQYILENPDIIPQDQRETHLTEVREAVFSLTDKQKRVAQEAHRNFKINESLRAYETAKHILDEEAAKDPVEQDTRRILAAKKDIKEIPPEHIKIAEEMLVNNEHIPGEDIRGHIEVVLSRERVNIARFAAEVILREEEVGYDIRHAIALDRAYEYMEVMLSEGVKNGTLMGLDFSLNNLYEDEYRKKLGEGKVTISDIIRLNQLKEQMKELTPDFFRRHSNHMTDAQIRQWKDVRSFSIERAFQKLADTLEIPREEWVRAVRSEQEAYSQLKLGNITPEQYHETMWGISFKARQETLLVSKNGKIQMAEARRNAGDITGEELEDLREFYQEEYQIGLSNLRERRELIYEWTPRKAELEIFRSQYDSQMQAQQGETFWTRQMGYVYLAGETPEQIHAGVRNFLAAATNSESSFDAQRYIEDGVRLEQEIIMKGKLAGLSSKECEELAAEASGTLLLHVARYFATIAFTNEWHQVTLMYTKHFNSKTSAIVKAYDGKVQLAADILDHDDGHIDGGQSYDESLDYAIYGRPVRYDGAINRDQDPEALSRNNEKAGIERARHKRRLIRRIALVELKSRNQIITEHINDRVQGTPDPDSIREVIASFGFDITTNKDSLHQLFKNRNYLQVITAIRKKIKDLEPLRLTPQEQRLLKLDRIRLHDRNKDLVSIDQTHSQFRGLYTEGELALLDEVRRLKEITPDYDTQVKSLQDQLPVLYEEAGCRLNEARVSGDKETSLDFIFRGTVGGFNQQQRSILIDKLLKDFIDRPEGWSKWSDAEKAFLNFAIPGFDKKWEDANGAVDLALNIRDVFYISTDRACAGIRVRSDQTELSRIMPLIPQIKQKQQLGQLLTEEESEDLRYYEQRGEILSFNDGIRFSKFVRERAFQYLPPVVAKTISGATTNGQSSIYVDIADKLEFINLAARIQEDPSAEGKYKTGAAEGVKLITLSSSELANAVYVQAINDAITRSFHRLKELGSDITVAQVDEAILEAFEDMEDILVNPRIPPQHGTKVEARGQLKTPAAGVLIDVDEANMDGRLAKSSISTHGGEGLRRETVTYWDIVNREDADPQYNFNAMDDQKHRSLLLSDENRTAAYNPDHPNYYSQLAKTLRVLDPDGDRIKRIPEDPLKEKVEAYRVMEAQRRFLFAVDYVKTWESFDYPDLYGNSDEETGLVKWDSDIVQGLMNSPFTGRRMIEEGVWAKGDLGYIYRGRGFMKYHTSNFRGLDHGVRGLRGITATYEGYDPALKDAAEGAYDPYKLDRWLDAAKAADALRSILIGGQVGQDPDFPGILKKTLVTAGKNNAPAKIDYVVAQRKNKFKPQEDDIEYDEAEFDTPVLARIFNNKKALLSGGDYEAGILETLRIYERVVKYGNGFAYVGNVSFTPYAAKFTGDTAIKRIAYWSVVHPESIDTHTLNMFIIKAMLTPLPGSYFGAGATLLNELLRREILVK